MLLHTGMSKADKDKLRKICEDKKKTDLMLHNVLHNNKPTFEEGIEKI